MKKSQTIIAGGETKTHYTAKELAELPGMPDTESGVIRKAKLEGWPPQKRSGRGGGNEYPVSALPEATRAHLLGALIGQAPETKTTAVTIAIDKPLQAVTALKDWQRSTMEARLFFLRLVEQAEGVGLGVTRAIRTLCEQAKAGTLPPEAARLVPLANQRSGKDTKKRALSERTLFNWWSDWMKSGKSISALAPKDSSVDLATGLGKIPAWGAAFLEVYRQPQKPTVAGALEELAKTLPPGQCPSYSAVNRFLKKVGGVEKEKGRRTGQELRSIKPYVVRDTTGMWPGEVYISDGLTFKSWGVANPIHRRPFSPEICDVVDVATRKIVGWSCGLSESGHVMAAALRHSVELSGIPAGWYHDNGPGYENQLLTDDVTGILARCGITNMTSIALQSQSRGIIEALRKNLWHKAAKALPAYKGRDMDRQASMHVYKVIKKDMKTKGSSDYVMPWAEFLAWVAEIVEHYNNRPHSSLPKVRGEDGRLRYMTPNEAWQKAMAEGWKPMMLDEAELADLFLPEKLCKVHRGMVRIFGNTYYNGSLAEYHGDQVRVGYDIHDPSRVRIRDAEGRLLCYAGFEANKRRYVPVSASQQMTENRANTRLKRLAVKAESIELERLGTIEVQPLQTVIELPDEVIAGTARRLELEQKREENRQQYFNDIGEIYDDIRGRERQGAASEYEIKWANDKEKSSRDGKRCGLYKEDPNCAGRFKKVVKDDD